MSIFGAVVKGLGVLDLPWRMIARLLGCLAQFVLCVFTNDNDKKGGSGC